MFKEFNTTQALLYSTTFFTLTLTISKHVLNGLRQTTTYQINWLTGGSRLIFEITITTWKVKTLEKVTWKA